MKVELWPVGEVKPYPNNPRINDDGVDAVVASLREFGFRQPIVVDSDGVIICGHTRHKAAVNLGLEKVPVHVAQDLTPEQVKAYRIADNQTATLSDWDFELLPIELSELRASNYDLGLLGFEADELARLIDGEVQGGLCDPDEVPAPPDEAITRPGDLWLLGGHRLLCGDSTNPDDVQRLLEGRKPFMMVTDPPYGVEYDPDWRTTTEGLWTTGKSVASGKVLNDDRVEWTEAYKLFPGHVAYVWHAGRYAADLVRNLSESGFSIRTQIIWKKPRFIISRGHYHWGHEPCWYAVRKCGSAKWCGDRSQSTVWEISLNRNTETGHGTQKPIECMARPIRNHGSKDDDIYDPFLGSGTTLVAAEQLGRCCYGMEINPTYCDVVVERYRRFTGRKAERIACPGPNDQEKTPAEARV